MYSRKERKMKLENTLNETKKKFEEGYEATKKFVKEHQTELTVVLGITAVVSATMLIVVNGKYKKLRTDFYKVTNENTILKIDNKILKDKNQRLLERIDVKDAMFAALSSDATRHRSSLGAQQLAYKRWS